MIPDDKKVMITLWSDNCDNLTSEFGDNNYLVYGIWITGYQKEYKDYGVDDNYLYVCEPENVENFGELGIDNESYKKFSLENGAKLNPYCLHWNNKESAILSLKWLWKELNKLGYKVKIDIES